MAGLKPMTIDEHIKHHLDLEKMWEKGAKQAKDDGLIFAYEMHNAIATDHKHLAEWLTELKERRAADVQPVKGEKIGEVAPVWHNRKSIKG